MGSVTNGYVANRKKYQSNEYIQDLGLNWMDFQARQYDPQIGRFLGVDPLANAGGQEMWSPYAAMGNAPESMIDPNGLMASVSNMNLQQLVQFVTSMNTMFGSDNWSMDNGNIVMNNATAASAMFSSFVASGKGGAAFSNESMAYIGNQILESHNSSTSNILVGVSGNDLWSAIGDGSLAEVNVTGSRKLVNPMPEVAELVVGQNAFKIHNEAAALSRRSNGSRDWAGYAGYSWQQIKANDMFAGSGSLAYYRGTPESKTTTLYRAVSQAEVDDIAKSGFRIQAGGYETGKLFAPTLQEATQFGKYNFGLDGIPNTIIKVTVPNSVLNGATKFGADGMNAISIPANQLNLLRGVPLNYSPLFH